MHNFEYHASEIFLTHRALKVLRWDPSELVCEGKIWVSSWRCACLVTWFCYQMIAKPGNNTGPPSSWPDPYGVSFLSSNLIWSSLLLLCCVISCYIGQRYNETQLNYNISQELCTTFAWRFILFCCDLVKWSYPCPMKLLQVYTGFTLFNSLRPSDAYMRQ